MEKTIRIGKTRDRGNLYCIIRFDGKRLSITGVEGPLANGNAKGSCGQIVMHEWDIVEYAPGWAADKAEEFRRLWNEWHLNDMTAGSHAQEEWIKANPLDYAYPKSHYEVYRDALHSAGLNPDPNYLHNGKPYAYGSAWLFREVPADVIAWFEALPDTDITPAWV